LANLNHTLKYFRRRTGAVYFRRSEEESKRCGCKSEEEATPTVFGAGLAGEEVKAVTETEAKTGPVTESKAETLSSRCFAVAFHTSK
jgi:hypothetical protein